MAVKRFRSKTDGWLLAVLVAGMAVTVAGLAIAVRRGPAGPETAIAVIVLLAAVALIMSTLVATYYEVDSGTLTVRCGLFRWRIPIDAITSVTPTRNPLSSPALSLDRLRIRYGDRNIMVSPANRDGFLRAIGQDPGDGS